MGILLRRGRSRVAASASKPTEVHSLALAATADRRSADQRSAIAKKCGVAASASKPTEVHTLTLSVRAKSSQRAKAVARHRGVPLSRPVEEYFDRLAPAAGQHDSEAFFARWQGAFKIDPAALKDERLAAIMAKHVPDRARLPIAPGGRT